MTAARVESNKREQALAWELIEEIGRCDEGHPEGAMVKIIADAFARYRGELEQGAGESFRFSAERVQELERKLAALTKRP